MKRDSLRTILRVRRMTLDAAETAVAEAYNLEQAALARAEEAAAALEHEAQAATSLAGGDDQVEAFARWLPVGRRTMQRAHDARRDATTELDRARAVLTLARSSLRAVETLIEQRGQEEQLEVQRKEQRVLDELGSRREL